MRRTVVVWVFVAALLLTWAAGVGADVGRTSPAGGPAPAPTELQPGEPPKDAVPRPKPPMFTFGQNYLRVYVEYLYLPRRPQRTSSLFVTVSTCNKTPLRFTFAFESEPNKVYSATGEYLLVPYVALNQKGPLELATEVRTSQEQPRSIGIIQQLLGAAATAFTGGAAGTVSLLQGYADTANNLTLRLGKTTEVTDVNRGLILDAPSSSTVPLTPHMLYMFTEGKETFRAFSAAKPGGASQDIKESCVRAGLRADAVTEAKYPTLYKFATTRTELEDHYGCTQPGCVYRPRAKPGTTPTPCSLHPDTPLSNVWASDWFYPTGDDAYLVLTLERYDPYPDLECHPEQVSGVRDNFRQLAKILLEHAPPTSGDDTAKDVRTALIEAEGEKLIERLWELTNTGDVSLRDAETLVDVFVRRAQTFAGVDTKFSRAKLTSLARGFTADLPSYPDQVPGVRDIFRALDKALQQYALRAGDEKARRERDDCIRGLGEDLVGDLREMTDRGDITARDARTLVAAFIDRAGSFGGVPTKYDGAALRSLARCFGVECDPSVAEPAAKKPSAGAATPGP